jgi:hypothetical protein
VATSAGPFAVAAGTTLNLQAPQATGVYFSLVAIWNLSPFIGSLMVGGDQYFVQPFMADAYQVPTPGQPLPVTFLQAPNGLALPVPGQNSYITTTWYLPTDAISESYPVALPIPTINIDTIINPPPPPVTELLLATVPSGTSTVTVTVPNTIETLVMVTPSSPTATCTVTGDTTGYEYPVVQVEGGYVWWADVSSVIDPTVIITFVGLSAGTWYVLADISPRLTGTQDFADGTLAQAAPGMGTQIAGRDASQNLVAVRLTANSLLEVATCASNAPTYGQVAVLATATNVGSTRAGRTALTIHNPTGNTTVYIGDSSVTTGNGFQLEPGHSVTQAAPTQWCAIAAAPGNTISYTDE